MKNQLLSKLALFSLMLAMPAATAHGQKRPPTAKPKPIVLAVLNDGKYVEPIALIDAGELVPAFDGGTDMKLLTSLTKSYYRPGTVYKLVFGGADAGTVTIKRNDPTEECSRHTAEVTVASTRTKLRGMIMGLATSKNVRKGPGVRRLPTAEERAAVEGLVRDELVKNKVSATVTKSLRFHNMTAIDVDSDGRAEIVASAWVEPTKTSRAMVFMIADTGADGKVTAGFSEFREVKQDEVMSGDIKDVDSGVYHELLLDALEYDGDTTAEIFTYTQSFEGAGFTAYSRRSGKWVRAFEGSNYRCGY